MSKLKIEKIAVRSKTARRAGDTSPQEICDALKSLKCGESFVIRDFQSNHRALLAYARYLLGFRFIATKQPDSTFRIGRTK